MTTPSGMTDEKADPRSAEPRTEAGRQLATLIGNIRERANLPRFDFAYAEAILAIEAEAAAQALSAPPDEGRWEAAARTLAGMLARGRTDERRMQALEDILTRALAANERQTDA